MVKAESRRSFDAAIVLIAVSVVALAIVQAQPHDDQNVAVVFPPWIGSGEALKRIGAAGGAVVRAGAIDTILVTHGEGGDFPRRLHDAGAWLVIDPVAFGGCLTQPG